MPTAIERYARLFALTCLMALACEWLAPRRVFEQAGFPFFLLLWLHAVLPVATWAVVALAVRRGFAWAQWPILLLLVIVPAIPAANALRLLLMRTYGRLSFDMFVLSSLALVSGVAAAVVLLRPATRAWMILRRAELLSTTSTSIPQTQLGIYDAAGERHALHLRTDASWICIFSVHQPADPAAPERFTGLYIPPADQLPLILALRAFAKDTGLPPRDLDGALVAACCKAIGQAGARLSDIAALGPVYGFNCRWFEREAVLGEPSALGGTINATPHFCYSEALAALCGGDTKQMIASVVDDGEVIGVLSDNRKDDSCLWALSDLWNGTPGAMVFARFGSDGPTLEHSAAWPASVTGSRHTLEIAAIHQDPASQLIHMVGCGAGQAGVGITVFDTFCRVATYGLKPDMCISAHIHGWALQLKAASSQPLTISLDEVMSDSVRETFRDAFERDGQMTIDTGLMTTILEQGSPAAPSPLHYIQGIVTSVRDAGTLLGRDLRTLGVAVVRDGDDILLEIEVSVTNAVWQGCWPEVGDHVSGTVWLQALFDAPADHAPHVAGGDCCSEI